MNHVQITTHVTHNVIPTLMIQVDLSSNCLENNRNILGWPSHVQWTSNHNWGVLALITPFNLLPRRSLRSMAEEPTPRQPKRKMKLPDCLTMTPQSISPNCSNVSAWTKQKRVTWMHQMWILNIHQETLTFMWMHQVSWIGMGTENDNWFTWRS